MRLTEVPGPKPAPVIVRVFADPAVDDAGVDAVRITPGGHLESNRRPRREHVLAVYHDIPIARGT